MANLKAKNTPGSTGYGQSSLEREEGAEQRTLALRLSNADVGALRFLWCELASRVGLRSNMQFQRAELAKRSKRDPLDAEKRRDAELVRRAERKKAATAAELLAQRAAEALAAWPDHIRVNRTPDDEGAVTQDADEPPTKPKLKKWKILYRNGTAIAHGAEFSCMALGVGRTGGRFRVTPHDMEDPWTGEPVQGLVSELFEAEVWSDAKNNAQSKQVKECRAALLRMIEIGDGNLVNVLFSMYSNSQPPSEFPKLEDLAPLVLDTNTVLRHAALMTKRLRGDLFGASAPTEDQWALARMKDRRETVTPRTAAHDLLDRKSQETPERTAQRIVDIATIKTEATRLLICASVSYQRAKKSLCA